MEHIPKKIKIFINRPSSSALQNKNIKTNIFKIQAYDSICVDIFVLENLDKSLIILSVATGSISIASFATAIKAPVGIMSVSCSLKISISTGFVKRF